MVQNLKYPVNDSSLKLGVARCHNPLCMCPCDLIQQSHTGAEHNGPVYTHQRIIKVLTALRENWYRRVPLWVHIHPSDLMEQYWLVNMQKHSIMTTWWQNNLRGSIQVGPYVPVIELNNSSREYAEIQHPDRMVSKQKGYFVGPHMSLWFDRSIPDRRHVRIGPQLIWLVQLLLEQNRQPA